MNKNAKVATLLIRAQCSSDGGKGNYTLVASRRSHRDNCAGYGNKDVMILDALRLISQGGTKFKYSVICDPQGVADYIVYFETRINGEKLQVSFHSFNPELEKYVRNSFRIKWDHSIARIAAVKIYTHFVANGQYTDFAEYL